MHDLSGRVHGRARVSGVSIPDPFIWLAADYLSLEDDDPVILWPDKSPNGLDAGAAMVPPTFKTGVSPSGKPVVRFMGMNPLQTPLFPAINQPNTIFIAWDSNGAGRVLDGENDASRHIIDTSSTSVRTFAGAFLTYTRPVNFPRILIHTAVFDGPDSLIREDGVLRAAGNAGALATTMLTIGAHHNLGQNAFSGDIAEMIVYDRALSISEIEQVESYLYRKYFTVPLSGDVAGESELTGSIPDTVPLAGGMNANSHISASLAGKRGLAAGVSSTSSLTGQVGLHRELFGQLEGVSAVEAFLSRKRALMASVEGDSGLTSKIEVKTALFGTAQGESTLFATFTDELISTVALDGIVQLEIPLLGSFDRDVHLKGEVKTSGS